MTKSSIEELYAEIGKYNDFARTNRFKVFMETPFALKQKWPNEYMRKMSFICDATELPGKNLATFDRRTYGVSEKLPTQTVFQDITLNFLCTDDREFGMWQKVFFDDWLNYIHPSDTYNFRYKQDYAVDFTIIQYSVSSKEPDSEDILPNYGVRIYEAYPINMNQLSLNWADDGFIRLSMTFAYTSWERLYGKRDSNSLEQGLSSTEFQQNLTRVDSQYYPTGTQDPQEAARRGAIGRALALEARRREEQQ